MRPFVLDGRSVELSARGLKIKRGAPVWVPSDEAIARGYLPRFTALHFDLSLESRPDGIAVRGERHELDRMAAYCERLWLEMLEWLGSPEIQNTPIFDGTLGSLIRCYQGDKHSPYRDLQQSTQKCYADWCRTLTRYAPAYRLDRMDGRTFRKWFADLMAPAEPGGLPRLRLAKACVKQMLPILFGYGVEIGLDVCVKLRTILQHIELRVPTKTRDDWNARKPVRMDMDYVHAEAIVTEGIRRNTRRSLSVAIGVAAQFEFTIAQIDVIGWWEKVAPGKTRDMPHDAILIDGELWHPGLRYEDFLPDLQLDMKRSKNGRGGVFDVEEYPLFMRALGAIPADLRTGPVAIDEHGHPFYGRKAYHNAYRDVAQAAGVPQAVWNMRARHGGAKEADNAGAELSDIATHLQHANTATTRKHYIKATAEPTRRVARLRVASRGKNERA